MLTIKKIVDIFGSVSKQHVDIKQFDYGNNFDISVATDTTYPIVFLETPIQVNYPNDRKFKTLSFALNVLLKTEFDNKKDSISAISIAEDITDAILSKITNDYKQEFYITNVNGLSLENFSDDQLGGMRTELTITYSREYSVPTCYANKFDTSC